jgi:hypothetical protein
MKSPHTHKRPRLIVSFFENVYNRWFIYTRGLDHGESKVQANKHSDEYINQVVWLRNIDRLIRLLNKGTDFSNYAFIDVGCGSGVGMSYVRERYRFHSLIGLEHDQQTAHLAKHNLSRSRAFPHPTHILTIDAAEAILPTGPNVLFMFNPFGAETFSRFMMLNIRSLSEANSFLLLANDLLLEDALKYGELVCRDNRRNLSVVKFSKATDF